MDVRVRLFSFFRQYFEEPELWVTLPPGKNTVGDLLTLLEHRLGEAFAREVVGNIQDRQLLALIFVGSESILTLEELSTPLIPGDTVKFLPPMAGG